MKRIAFFLTICTLAACHKSLLNGPDNAKSIVLPASGADVMAAENQFTFDLFQAVNAQDTALKNKMISPYSVYMALGMTDNGAVGPTRDSIGAALRLGGLGVDDLNATARALIQQFPVEDGQVTMTTANSIWFDHSMTPAPAFLQTVQNDYMAAAQALNFSDPSSVTTINNWVSDETRQMIPQILKNIESDEALFLVNAIYFKGQWTNGFDAGKTRNGSFTNGNGTVESVPMMTFGTSASLKFVYNDTAMVLELPYGGRHFVMDIAMPVNGRDFRTFLNQVTRGRLGYWTSHLDSGNAVVTMPRFKFSYGVDNMQPELTKMGMGIAFGANANLTDLAPNAGAVSRVVHKTAIEVDETGSKAAAATAVGITMTSLPVTTPLNIDHAFLFTIRETTSGAVLFVGILNDPLDAGSGD